jgi:hypothetical protein
MMQNMAKPSDYLPQERTHISTFKNSLRAWQASYKARQASSGILVEKPPKQCRVRLMDANHASETVARGFALLGDGTPGMSDC